METFEKALQSAKESFGLNYELKEQQKRALQSFYEGKDTFCILPTGFGKSIIYQLTPFLNNKCTLIIGPLNSLIKDQVSSLAKRGVKSCYIDFTCSRGHTYQNEDSHQESNQESDDESMDKKEYESSVPLTEVMNGSYKLIYAHPEAILLTENGRKLMTSSSFTNKVGCVAVDEVHMIEEWGDGNFRPAFGKIRDIICVCECPVMVFTATATKATQDFIMKSLGMKDVTKICVNPDRPNIYYEKHMKDSDVYTQLNEILLNLLSDIYAAQNGGTEFPLTIMYTDLQYIGYAYMFMKKLYKRGPEEKIVPYIFAQYHSQYSESMKDLIIKDLTSGKPTIRLIFATIALGMGLNVPSVRKVIHFGPPSTLEKYIQETGRSGRDGEKATAILYWNKLDISNSKPGISKHLQSYCRSQRKCLREQLLDYLGFTIETPVDKCQCCCVCRPYCNCGGCPPDEDM